MSANMTGRRARARVRSHARRDGTGRCAARGGCASCPDEAGLHELEQDIGRPQCGGEGVGDVRWPTAAHRVQLGDAQRQMVDRGDLLGGAQPLAETGGGDLGEQAGDRRIPARSRRIAARERVPVHGDEPGAQGPKAGQGGNPLWAGGGGVGALQRHSRRRAGHRAGVGGVVAAVLVGAVGVGPVRRRRGEGRVGSLVLKAALLVVEVGLVAKTRALSGERGARSAPPARRRRPSLGEWTARLRSSITRGGRAGPERATWASQASLSSKTQWGWWVGVVSHQALSEDRPPIRSKNGEPSRGRTSERKRSKSTPLRLVDRQLVGLHREPEIGAGDRCARRGDGHRDGAGRSRGGEHERGTASRAGPGANSRFVASVLAPHSGEL